jgi:light-regulated signal transduction histidine kinase (bacteriophytochrome)
MTALIQGVLALSRISTRAGTRERVSLDRTVGEVLADLELRLRDSGGRVEAGELPDLEAEPVQMRQLMQNLIGNALKFHKPGVPPCVRVYARPAEEAERDAVGEDAVAIVVEDDGIGFDPAQSDRIFNIFQRLHTRQEYEGTGIGLAVCRKIVERHGGRIRAECEPGRGARFVIVLPRTAEAEE